jgi:hypothetical protein
MKLIINFAQPLTEMTNSNPDGSVDPVELRSRFQEKSLAIETAIAVQKPHSEINELYQQLKIIQQELNLANLQEELSKGASV